ncbi:MAG TPA: hypothetical protein LFV91_03655 [Rickettsia endosymbiont of Bembidion nr. Transversale]|nr:hypothetical protein [Rickettsia endosymbiont of Stiretrus anchorago]HJD66139.1 hypothetical protein [Rickettsia endosymbiont of Bembidion nr. Transversale]
MIKDTTDTLNNLYNFTTKLILLLEDELESLTLNKSENNLADTKNIAEILNKLVNLLIQLNKLPNNQVTFEASKIDEKDKMIIDNFLKNYNLKSIF